MKAHYYQETDSLYIDLADRPSATSSSIAPGVVVDFDGTGRIVGIDIDNASKIVNLDQFESRHFPSGKRLEKQPA